VPFKAAAIKTNETFHIKHLSTGFYLALIKCEGEEDKYYYTCLRDKNDKSCKFILKRDSTDK